MNKFIYKNVILYTSHQWCGNTLEYFLRRSNKLLVFLLMPRVQNKDNIIQIYENGKLVKEVNISLSENFFLYYFLWYVQYIRALFTYFPRNEKVVVITAHPYIFFLMTIQKIFRKIDFVYWIADYFPPINRTLYYYEKLKKFYHDGIKYRVYLGDGVNKLMNGRVVDTLYSKTILWGVKPKTIYRNLSKTHNTILYVGVIRPNVGLEIVYQFLKDNPKYTLKVIGVCDEAYYKINRDMIIRLGIGQQVYFPNRFFFDHELNTISKQCFVGIALYDTSPTSTIYYSDPGKVKAYTEMQLPVIMTKTSCIYPYIEKFKAGEVISRNAQSLGKALKQIETSYGTYLSGVKRFNKYFHYETYYDSKFTFLNEAFK